MELKEIIKNKENSVLEIAQEVRILKSLEIIKDEAKHLKELVQVYESSTSGDVNNIEGFVKNYPFKHSILEIWD